MADGVTNRRRIFALLGLCCAGMSVAAGAEAGTYQPWELSAGLGIQFPTSYTAGSGSAAVGVAASNGVYTRVGLDRFFGEYLGAGLHFGYAATSTSPDGDVSIPEVGLALKGRYPIHQLLGDADFLITPALSLTYRRFAPERSSGSHGMGVNLGVDLRLRWASIDFFVEPGFLSQPIGGSGPVERTFDPHAYFLVGFGIPFGGAGGSADDGFD